MNTIPLTTYTTQMWGMAALLFLLGWAWYKQPQWMRSVFSLSFDRVERNYGEATMDIFTYILLSIYMTGTMGICLLTLHPYLKWWVILLSVGYVVYKVASIGLIDWTFQLHRFFQVPYYTYFQQWLLFAICLFPYTLLVLRYGNTLPLLITGIILLAVQLLILIIKAIKVFYRNPISLLYITIYIAVIEIIPISVVLYI